MHVEGVVGLYKVCYLRRVSLLFQSKMLAIYLDGEGSG